MTQELQKNQSKDTGNGTSLWALPPDGCCRKYLLKLAQQELDTTVNSAFAQIRNIAWNNDGDDAMQKLLKIGEIADAFHNFGANPPHELVKAIIADCTGCPPSLNNSLLICPRSTTHFVHNICS